jgi:hypothetical protein
MAVLLTLTFAGTYWRLHSVRPQLFSIVLFAVLLVTITRADRGQPRGLLMVPPLMALWANLHGGWIVGLGVLGAWTAARVVDGRMRLADRGRLAAIGLAAVAATLLNPYGLGMWIFLGETVRLGRADIEDWGSVLTDPLALGLPWAITAAVGGLAVWRSTRPRRWD